jgi:lipopolysaccharide export system permease protein
VKILQSLYLKDFLKLLMLITLGLSVIFSLIELVGKIDNFMAANAPFRALAMYTIYNMPGFLIYLLPMSVLICSLFIFTQAFRRHEIAAIKAAGGRLRTLFYPFITTGLLLSLFAFMTNELIVPRFSEKASALKNRLDGKEKTSVFSNGTIWLKTREGSPVKIDLYIPEKNLAANVSIFILGAEFLEEQIFARDAFWNGNIWILQNAWRLRTSTGEVEKIKSMEFAGLESPDLFTNELKTTDEMGIYELYTYIGRLKNAGFNNLKLIVDFNSKLSFPLINIFMMLLGIALSTRSKKGGGLVTAGLGLLISLFYWLGYTFSLSIGYAGIVHPVLAAWSMPFLFGTLSVYLFIKTPE